MTDHFVEVPKKVLSPAAQAVLDAYYDAAKAVLDICGDFEIGSARNEGIAAALRALADQVTPSDAVEPRNYLPIAIECQRIRAEILAIATELEGTRDESIRGEKIDRT